jgi:hypothetical protein
MATCFAFSTILRGRQSEGEDRAPKRYRLVQIRGFQYRQTALLSRFGWLFLDLRLMRRRILFWLASEAK